jgi:cell division protein FtsW
MMVTMLNRDRINAPNYDQGLLWVTMILLGIGLVMVYSASIAIAEADKAVGNNSSYYLVRQAIFLVISVSAAFVAFNIPVAWWQKMAPYLFLLGLALLVLVLIPGVGRVVGGSRR